MKYAKIELSLPGKTKCESPPKSVLEAAKRALLEEKLMLCMKK